MRTIASPTALVGQLALLLARAHTEASLVLSLLGFFGERAAVEWVELGFDDGGRALRARPGSIAPEHRRARPSAKLERAARASVLHVRSDSKLPELRKAFRLGVRALLVLPVLDQALVTVALRKAPQEALGDHDTLRALADVTSAALQTCHAFARVGEVSRRAHVESKELRTTVALQRVEPKIIAASPIMRRLIDDVLPQVARHDATVLLLGESGVGKELLAREIHERSQRANRPMLAVNCGALPETVVDSTLFGHERGAFTGAASRQVGIFERAHRGTLFLDEVGELSPMVQAKLLRVLEHGELERVGSGTTVHVDVRVIAATNRDLEAMVRDGAFRLDLYHRLAIVPIAVPPLRERREDIDVLVPALLERVARRAGAHVILPTPAQMRRLRSHAWPGNVRELENTLARALIFAEHGKLAVDAMLKESGKPRSSTAEGVTTFADASRRCIEAALAASGGRIHGEGGAAALLRLKPTTLQSKMRKLGVARAKRS